jgi:glycosyltransferase involved in cell wall biosynthesis
MKNILFIIYRLYGGGAERVVSNLTQALEGKYNIKIAVFSNEEKTYPYAGEMIRIRLPFSKDPSRNNKVKRLLRLLILIQKLRYLKKKHRINVSLSFGEQANIVNILSRVKDRICISMRTTLSKEMETSTKMHILSSFIKKLYNKADKVIVPSRLAALDLKQFFNVHQSKLQVIYNYINPETINQLSEEPITDINLSTLFGKQILLNVGRITPAKGQWLLFHVLKRIKKYQLDVRIVIIGDGESEYPFKLRLIEYAKNLGLKIYDHCNKERIFALDYDIYFIGFDANPFRYMKRSRLLVFPSTFEGFPNTIIEAMQSRLVVLSADCQSGPREILAPNTDPANHTTTVEQSLYGILAPALPTSSIETPINEFIIDEWEKGIIAILENENLQQHYIEQGLKRALDFESKRILEEWKRILLELTL